MIVVGIFFYFWWRET